MSKVKLQGTDVESYSGYFTVNEQYQSNIFFWFFPAKKGAANAPLALWLQGGPGGSSMFGLFVEHGPFTVDNKLDLVPRNLSWNNHINMLYIDNPVGTGFSFTRDDRGYSRNQDDVAENLYSALTQFFTVFHEYADNDFYVTGESYAGKYVPAISYKIHVENQVAPKKIKLEGMAIGDGLVDPVNMLDYGTLLYEIGLVDNMQRAQIDQTTARVAELCTSGDYLTAFHAWDTVLNGDITPYPTFFNNFTGFHNYFNYLYPTDPLQSIPYDSFLNQASTRSAIHVGNLPFNDGSRVEHFLLADVMNSTAPLVSRLLDHDYRVLVYSGQLDLIVAYSLTRNWLHKLEWKGAGKFRGADRRIWQDADSGEIIGYLRMSDNLHEVLVRNAGHMLPSDQPLAGYRLINYFIDRQSDFFY